MRLGQHPSNWLRILRRTLFAGVLAGMSQVSLAESPYAAAWGPSIGTSAPLLAATDQDGNAQSLDTLTGSKGLLFVSNRSVDW